MAKKDITPCDKPTHFNFKDLTGQQFGRLLVISLAGYTLDIKNNRCYYWLCQCRCKNETTVRSGGLTSGGSQSCGCLNKERTSSVKKTHGEGNDSPEFRAWCKMIQRCTDTNSKDFEGYGGRGITVHESFRGPTGYIAFLSEVGRKPSKAHSLDRIINSANYEPGNIRWASARTQANNTRRNKRLTYGGESLTYSQWGRKLGFRDGVISRRIMRGWSVEDSINTPVGQRRK